MKFTITLKDPDGVYESLKDVGLNIDDLPPDVERLFERFFLYKEYVTLLIDTDAGNVTVLES